MFAAATAESRLALHADEHLPLWDKVVHAIAGLGLLLAIAPRTGRRAPAFAAVLGLGVAWEVAQFVIDPFQGKTPVPYAIDTVTDVLADAAGAVAGLVRMDRSRTQPSDAVADQRPAGRTA